MQDSRAHALPSHVVDRVSILTVYCADPTLPSARNTKPCPTAHVGTHPRCPTPSCPCRRFSARDGITRRQAKGHQAQCRIAPGGQGQHRASAEYWELRWTATRSGLPCQGPENPFEREDGEEAQQGLEVRLEGRSLACVMVSMRSLIRVVLLAASPRNSFDRPGSLLGSRLRAEPGINSYTTYLCIHTSSRLPQVPPLPST